MITIKIELESHTDLNILMKEIRHECKCCQWPWDLNVESIDMGYLDKDHHLIIVKVDNKDDFVVKFIFSNAVDCEYRNVEVIRESWIEGLST